jgi:uncharacterized protein YbjT (DUF2867 family)
MELLITGATGNIGRRVVDLLLAGGKRPRVLVRNLEKAQAYFGEQVDIVVGDLARPDSLADALHGIEAVLLINAEGPDLPRRDGAFARAARFEGVRRVVKLSAYSAALPDGAGSALGRWHAEGEAAVRASGVSCTVLQPTGFMSNALTWARSIKTSGVVRASAGEGRIAMIHPDDIARVAAEVLRSPTWEGQTLALTGPQALTYGEMTAAIGAAIGKPVAFEALSDSQAREQLLALGLPPPLTEGLVALWRTVREGKVGRVTDSVERVTGRTALTFDHWARDHAAAFV